MKPILFLCIFFQGLLYSQSNGSGDAKRFALGVNFSPDRCYRVWWAAPWNRKSIPGYRSKVDFRDSMETPRIGFTAGVGVLYRKSVNLTFESGLYYASKGVNMIRTKLIPITPDPYLPDYASFTFRENYLELPLKANYTFRSGRLNGYVTGGFSSNVFWSAKSVGLFEYSDGRTERVVGSLAGPSRFNFSIVAGLGMDYQLSERWAIRMEPTFRHAITPSVFGTDIGYYWHSLGLQTGVYLRL